MKIAFTTIDGNSESPVAQSFGMCEKFVLYDSKTNSYASLNNPYKNVFGKAGIQAAQLLIANDVNSVVTGKIGSSALRFLYFADVKVYTNTKESIKVTLEKLLKEEIIPVNSIEQNSQPNQMRKRYRNRFSNEQTIEKQKRRSN